MSNLLVQNIKHTNNTTSMTVDSSGQVTIRGEGSQQTSIQQGLCKAWTTYTDVSWTIGDSFNCSAATDNGAADFTTNFTNNFASDNIVSAGFSTYATYVSYHNSAGNTHTTSSVEY